MENTMSKYDKEYDAFKIFEEIQTSKEEEAALTSSQAEDMYYEIEYDSCPMPGVGRFVLKSQKIEAPARDEIRDIFNQMRDIGRERRTFTLNQSKFYDKRVQQENSQVFYEQGLFMKDFEDKYPKSVPYNAYFPCYQMMGYEQLRTYFTWRTEVRKGVVQDTSLSYAFLYIYELLNNIGVANPKDGLDRLMFFWKEFRTFNRTIDKYMPEWLKDYHIYYELPQSFKAFTDQYGLGAYYHKLVDPEDNFELLCSISKYDIRKSAFYTDERTKLIQDCFDFTLGRIKHIFEENAICFEEAIFQPVKNMTVWTPFKGALFYPWLRQQDRKVVLSEKEIYICTQNRFTFNTTLTTESGRQLLGYIMKQMEAVLRRKTKYKYKLTAGIAAVDRVLLARLDYLGISLEKVIADAVEEFYREATKTVVRVDVAALAKIRQEALLTQERLIVPESEEPGVAVSIGAGTFKPAVEVMSSSQPAKEAAAAETSMSDSWGELRSILSEVERQALSMALQGEADIKGFADSCGVMLEVLLDGINEKAMDLVGDSLLDDEFTIYDDYMEQVKRMVE